MEVPRFWYDPDVTGMAVAAIRLRMAGFIPAQRAWDNAVRVRQLVGPRRPVDNAYGHQVDDAFLAALHFTLDLHQPRSHDHGALALHIAGPHQCIDHAGFIFDRDEYPISFAAPLADEAPPCRPPLAAAGCGVGFGAA